MDKRDKDIDEAVDKASHCVGSLQMMNNSCARSRDAKILQEQKQVGKNPDVFTHPAEFAAWHDDPKVAAIRRKISQKE